MRKLVMMIGGLMLSFQMLSAQTVNSIKQLQAKSEKEIAYLNKLLSETKSSQSSTLSQLSLIEAKIRTNQSYIHSLESEIKRLERSITNNKSSIDKFTFKKEELLTLYHHSIYNGWKRRDQNNSLMFLLSAKDFNQAYSRFRNLQRLQDYSIKQINQIQALNDSLSLKNSELKTLVEGKEKSLTELSVQRNQYTKNQQTYKSTVSKLKSQERSLRSKLEAEMNQRRKLARQLSDLIAKQTKKSGGSSGKYKLTPEEKIISTDFVKNKGRLPWPVEKGIISERYGIRQHPVYNRVEVINNGITIATSKGSDARTVFKGIVTEIWFVPGMNNVVIVRHGNYLTVYSNLEKVYVNKGATVSTKQAIGRIATDVTKGTLLNFQIWQDTQKMNPEYWLAK